MRCHCAVSFFFLSIECNECLSVGFCCCCCSKFCCGGKVMPILDAEKGFSAEKKRHLKSMAMHKIFINNDSDDKSSSSSSNSKLGDKWKTTKSKYFTFITMYLRYVFVHPSHSIVMFALLSSLDLTFLFFPCLVHGLILTLRNQTLSDTYSRFFSAD